jgi:CHAT domain-containing protein
VKSDGVAGLLYAVHVAGARTTIASLWPIPDEATESLMRTYYGALLEGVPRIEALRQAQRALTGTLPAWQWAAYVSYGDPAPIQYRPNVMRS